MAIYRVVFEIETNNPSPEKWDWNSLIDCEPDERIDILSVEEVL